MDVSYQVEVNNVPKDSFEWIVARWSPVSCDLWFWGSYESEKQAREIANFLDGIVVRRLENE